MNTGRTGRAKYNIIAGTINRILVLFLGFLIRTFIIRYLGTPYVGLGGVVTSVLNILNLAEMGFSSAVIFNLYKPVSEKNREMVCALLAFYRKAYLAIGSFVFAAGILLLPFLHLFIHKDIPDGVNLYIVYFVYLLNTCIGYFLFGYINVLLNAHQRNDIDSYLSMLTYVIEYGAQIAVLILFKSYYLYIFVIPPTTVLMNCVRYFTVRRLYPEYICRGSIDEAARKSVYENIRGLVIQKICASTRNTFDSIFISGYIGLNAAGLYSNYFYVISSVHGLLVVLNSALSAGIGNSIAVETREKNHQDMMKIVFIYGWLSGICAICILCLYQPFMKLWAGEANLLPFSNVVLFCLYFYALTIGDVRANYSAGAGLWWHERYRALAELAANVILNAVLGKWFGIPGIIGATLITIVFINFLYGSGIVYKYYFTEQKVTRYMRQHGLQFLVTGVTAVPVYYVSTFVRLDGFVRIAAAGILAFVLSNVSFFAVYRKRILFNESLQLLKRMIRDR